MYRILDDNKEVGMVVYLLRAIVVPVGASVPGQTIPTILFERKMRAREVNAMSAGGSCQVWQSVPVRTMQAVSDKDRRDRLS